MPEAVNLAGEIKRQLPAELVDLLGLAGSLAAEMGTDLYLAGGAVRDLLLGRSNLDLDLVVYRGADELGRRLAAATSARLLVHRRFKTAKLSIDNWSIDIATVRSETYERPGALPRVGPGTLETDMFRRDFTINAMAIELTTGRYGRLIDLYGGQADLHKRLVRVLHENSFTDDATRIWRAIRYEQRLVFNIERATLKLLKRDIHMLNTVSADRIRRELELVLKEDHPEKALRRAGDLGVLARLHPSLRAGGWLARKLRQAREQSAEGSDLSLSLALLAYSLNEGEVTELIERIKMPGAPARALKDTVRLRQHLGAIEEPRLRPSMIHDLLRGFSHTAIEANRIAARSPITRRRLALYLNTLRYVEPSLTGDDLAKMGVRPGPGMREVLQRLMEARLDGIVKTRREESELVQREFLSSRSPS